MGAESALPWDRERPARAKKISRTRASEISEEGSLRYRALQKKDKKTAHPSPSLPHFLGNIDS
jgi:hypothetical protein